MSWWSKAFGKSAISAASYKNPVNPQGPYTHLFQNFVAREVNPWLYEAIRESIGFVDGTINRLKMLDGILRIETESDRLRGLISDWMDSVQVGDMEHGLQAFYELQSNEMYEQGFSVGDFTLSEQGNDVIKLTVADSKGIHFRREDTELQTWYRPPGNPRGRGDGTDQIERVLRNRYQTALQSVTGLGTQGYKLLNSESILYTVFHPEADGPYGVSVMRSNEFDAKVLLTMKNSVMRVWERFGDPIFHMAYSTKNSRVDQTELNKRRDDLHTSLTATLDRKASGNSADLVTAVGANDEIKLSIIGSDNSVLEIEMPARFILESVVAKSGLAPWMLGLVWGTSERLAQRQADAALHDSKVRFERRRPALKRLIETAMRARGVTWKPDEWRIIQEVPSLQDILAVAQAEFLETQAQLMRGQAESGEPMTIETGTKVNRAGELEFNFGLKATTPPDRTKDTDGEPWAEDDPELPEITARAETRMLHLWGLMADDVIDVLGLTGLKAESPVFTFSRADLLPQLDEMYTAFVELMGAKDGALVFGMLEAWLRGMDNAAVELNVESAAEAAQAVKREIMAERGMRLVRNTAVRALRSDIIEDLANGVYDGLPPADVARKLRVRFEMHEYDWLRLARSEIAFAQVAGKEDQYRESGIDLYNYKTAGDSLVSSICRSNAAGSPYPVGDGPLPMRDSHPNCRCTITAHVE